MVCFGACFFVIGFLCWFSLFLAFLYDAADRVETLLLFGGCVCSCWSRCCVCCRCCSAVAAVAAAAAAATAVVVAAWSVLMCGIRWLVGSVGAAVELVVIVVNDGITANGLCVVFGFTWWTWL